MKSCPSRSVPIVLGLFSVVLGGGVLPCVITRGADEAAIAGTGTKAVLDFTPEQSLEFVRRAYDQFDRSTVNGCWYMLSGRTFSAKKIGPTVCVAGDIGSGMKTVINEHGTFIIRHDVAFRMDMNKSLQADAQNSKGQFELPKIPPTALIKFLGIKAGGTDYQFKVIVPDEVVLAEARIAKLTNDKVNESQSLDWFRELIPASQLVTATPTGRLVSVEQFSQSGKLLPKQSMTVIESEKNSLPIPDEVFADPKERIIPVKSMEELYTTVKTTEAAWKAKVQAGKN